jgi:hypothetical protein
LVVVTTPLLEEAVRQVRRQLAMGGAATGGLGVPLSVLEERMAAIWPVAGVFCGGGGAEGTAIPAPTPLHLFRKFLVVA